MLCTRCKNEEADWIFGEYEAYCQLCWEAYCGEQWWATYGGLLREVK